MLNRKTIVGIFFLLLCNISLWAQWDVSLNQYWALKGYYNPSIVGENEEIRITGAYQNLWSGIESAPKTTIIMADMPFQLWGKRHGLGVILNTQTIGTKNNSLIAVQYAYRQQIRKGFISIGVQAGIYRLAFDAGNLTLTDDSTKNNTAMIRTNFTDKSAPDFNAGLSWNNRRLFLAISAMHLSEPSFYAQPDSTTTTNEQTTDSIKYHIPRSYNFIASYNIPLFYSLEIQPMIWIQATKAETRIQGTMKAIYKQKYSGGASWVKNNGYVFFAGAIIRDIEAGYAYSLHTQGIGKDSKGSHEIYVRYRLPIDVFNEKTAPHKSIRLL